NVPPVKAKIMYSAVYLGGPKWVELVPGQSCGPNCIFDAAAESDNHIRTGDSVLYYRDALHEDEELQRNFVMISKVIEAVPEISLSDIETILNTLQDDD